MHDNSPRRDLIVSTLLRFGFTIGLCSLPFLAWGVNGTAAGFALLLFAPCSFLLGKPIVGWLGELLTFFNRQPLAAYQGQYYQFEGIQIRIHIVDKAMWVVAVDVLKVLGEKPTLMLESQYDAMEYDTIPGTRLHGFSEAGVEKFLLASTHSEAQKMLLWLQREVFKPHRRKLELAAGSR